MDPALGGQHVVTGAGIRDKETQNIKRNGEHFRNIHNGSFIMGRICFLTLQLCFYIPVQHCIFNTSMVILNRVSMGRYLGNNS